LNVIIRETQRCKSIVGGLLEFSRSKESRKVLADINGVMVKALNVVKNESYLRRVTVDKNLSPTMTKMLLDENQIEQVFINLLLNALNAVEECGRITIESSVDQMNNRIKVEIADNGCGIPAEDVDKIFEPFYTTRSDGTGLGLAVSYGIIENHQGIIQVISEPGKGTRFVLEFPISDENSPVKESV